jgi:hypothetical protein
MDFLGAFREKFAAPENAAKRIKAERRANLTPKQRRRRGPPKKQTNFRATEQTRTLLAALSAHLTRTEGYDVGQGDVIERALPLLAEKLRGSGFQEPK